MQTLDRMTRATIRLLYDRLTRGGNADIGARFLGWFAHFEFVHGQLERKRSVDRDQIITLYDLDPMKSERGRRHLKHLLP